MADPSGALLVLNAGSSSLKFSVFRDDEPPRPVLRGQLQELWTRPRLVARANGAVVQERDWPAGTRLGHEGAIEHLLGEARRGALGGYGVAAVGHRVVHGGTRFSEPVLVDAETLTAV